MAGSERPAAHDYMLTRAGLPIVYTDGYNIAGGPDYFPKPAHIPFLGQFGQNYITAHAAGPARLHPRRSDSEVERRGILHVGIPRQEREPGDERRRRDDAPGHARAQLHRRPADARRLPRFPAGARLRNLSPHGGGFYATVGNDGKLRGDDGGIVTVPSGGYFAFSWERPGTAGRVPGRLRRAVDRNPPRPRPNPRRRPSGCRRST